MLVAMVVALRRYLQPDPYAGWEWSLAGPVPVHGPKTIGRQMVEYKTVLLDVENGVATLTLNRPDSRNALNALIMEELCQALDQLAQNPEVRVLIVTGKGDVFCAGGDIREHPSLRAENAISRNDHIQEAQNLPLRLHGFEKPVIAAINGPAFGAGFDLAMGCDIRIAAEEANFAEVFVKLGLMPDYGGTYFLSRIVGVAKALELILTGDSIDAAEALNLGLVNKVVSAQDLLPQARDLAERLAKGPSVAHRFIKNAVYSNTRGTLEEALEREKDGQVILMDTEDVKNAVKSFGDKRPLVFAGK
jgi:2-(1,2-epoxy-1,2-dihydrophenyl)acetyl-CoA isomerase